MTPLANGIYRISQYGTYEQPQILTLGDTGEVTILPPGGASEMAQEGSCNTSLSDNLIWSLENLQNGNIAIQNPARLFPSRSLSYDGEAQEGNRIVTGRIADFPTREWSVEPAPQKLSPQPYFIRVLNKDLIVGVSPVSVYPPQLVLGSDSDNLDKAWVFELVDPR